MDFPGQPKCEISFIIHFTTMRMRCSTSVSADFTEFIYQKLPFAAPLQEFLSECKMLTMDTWIKNDAWLTL